MGQQVLTGIIIGLVIISIIIALRAYGVRLAIYKPTLNKLIPFSLTNALISLYFIFVNFI